MILYTCANFESYPMSLITEFGDVIDVNTLESGEQTQPNVTALSNGSFVVVWLDSQASGDAAIRTQMYDATGDAVGRNFDVASGSHLEAPIVTQLTDGGFVIVWVANDGSATQSAGSIMAQRFDANGQAVGTVIEIDTQVEEENRGVNLHDVTALDGGGYVVGWEVQEPGYFNDYFQIIDGSDVAQLSPATIYSNGNPFDTYGTLDNQIVSNGDGGFSLAYRVFEDLFQSYPIIFRIYDSSGNQIFQRYFEQTEGSTPYASSINIEALSDGSYAVMRTLRTDISSTEGTGTVLVIYASDGSVVMDDTFISEDSGDLLSMVALDGSFLVKLSSETTGTEYANDGTVIATNVEIPDGFLDSVVNSSGLTASVITGTDSDGSGIDLQLFTAMDAPVTVISAFGDPIDVNTDEVGEQTRPDIAVLEDGNFAVVWLDSNEGDGSFSQRDGYSIKLQVYDASGTALGGEVDVSSMSEFGADRGIPKVAGLSDGTMIVVWTQVNPTATSGNLVMAQKYSATGQPLGAAYEIYTDLSSNDSGVSLHDVVALDNGSYAVHWQEVDNSGPWPTDSFQIIDSSGAPVLVTPQNYTSSNDYSDPAGGNTMAALGNGGFAIAWVNYYEMISPQAEVSFYDSAGVQVFNREFLIGYDVSFDAYSSGINIETLSDGSLAVTWHIIDNQSSGQTSTNLAIYAADGTQTLADTVLSTEINDVVGLVALDGSFIVKLSSETTATEYANDGVVLTTGVTIPEGFTNAVSSYGGLVATVSTGTDSDGSGIDIQFFTTSEGQTIGTDQADVLNGSEGADVLSGLGGDDTLNGLGGNDVLSGGIGSDTLNGVDGNDTLVMGQGGAIGAGDIGNGGADDDVFQITSLNPDSLHTINGGEGSDTMDITAYTGNAQFTVDLSSESWVYTGTTQNVVASFTSIENFISGNQDDVITGDGSDNVLSGGGGADTLIGGAGNDTLIGGTGIDIYDGGEGSDLVDYGDFGIDIIIRMDQGRALIGPSQVEETYTNVESFQLGTGNDLFIGNEAGNTVYAGAGNDVLHGSVFDRLYGEEGDDIFYIATGVFIDGGSGYDRAFAFSYAGSLNVNLGETNLEFVSGSSEGDTLNAVNVAEAVKLFGNGGNDVLTGSAFDDYINGGAGDDILDGLTNADSVSGGAGDDIIFVDHLDALIDGGADYDQIFVRGYAQNHTYNIGGGNLEYANGNIADDTFDGSAATWSVKLLGQGGDDTLIGNGGNDILNASAGADSLDGGAGDDIIFMDDHDISVIGGEGYDRVYANGTSGALTFDLTAAGVEYVSGSTQGDSFTAAGSLVAVKLLGRAGADALAGGNANDLLYGEAGADTLIGNGGDDFLSGGAGTDTFVFTSNWGQDKIADFTDGTDILDMTALGITFADLMISVNAFGNAVVNYDGQSITLLGVQAADVDAGDFSF